MEKHYLDAQTEERLGQFFGGWFHQDWDVVAPTWEGVLQAFLRETDTRTVAQLERDLRALVDRTPSDDASFGDYLDVLGSDYQPVPETKAWVVELVEAVARELVRRQAPRPVE